MHATQPDHAFFESRSNPQERFRLRFQSGLKQYLSTRESVAEGFGIVWEQTLDEVPLEDKLQRALYARLLDWARNAELFTKRNDSELLQAWRQEIQGF